MVARRIWPKCALTVLCCAVLSACASGKLEELRRVPPQGSAFDTQLAELYLGFAESEAQQYDWIDSNYFAGKAMRALYGKETEPESPERWSISGPPAEALTKARSDLAAVLTADAKKTYPSTAAQAQFYFDCWVEQQEEGWDQAEIGACRDAFFQQLQALQRPDVLAVPDGSGYTLSTSHIVYFASGSRKLDKEAEKQIAELVADLKHGAAAGETFNITLNGHADAVGTVHYNQALSEQRADAVKRFLVARGIAESRITTYGFGETDPAVPTADGAPERRNRRVEIFF